jgi:hypothetical protein
VTTERAADELYGLPLADFTRARDDMARSLRREGRREEAEAVKALRKPTVAAWALNQLARRRPKDVERLVATGERLREAQEALLAGGDRSALQRATAEERELVAKLTRDAIALASEGGTGATATLGERIASTLHAAALDEETAAELAAGRLLREREAVGLFGAASVELRPARRAVSAAASESPAGASTGAAAKSRRRAAGADAEARRAAERREAERELAAARAEERKARRERAAAAKATEHADKRAQDAQSRADEARERADEARAGVREAKQREREAAKALERATRAVASAEKKLA